MSQKILITGANGGFGRLTLESLLHNNHQVVASMRDIDGRNKELANEFTNLGARVVEIDVTDDDKVASGVSQAIEALDGLDVLINNAGTGAHGIMEDFSTDEMKSLFDINLFGVQRMNRAVLPFFRSQHSGLLLHISSLLGRMTLPFYGPYNASKWALEALVENYRSELSGFGVDVCMIEPGGYPTTFMSNLVKPKDQSRHTSYGDFAQAPSFSLEHFRAALQANPQQNPQDVADAALMLVNTQPGARPFRTICDRLGMGTHIEEYNQHLEKFTTEIYSNFGIEHMLKLNSTID